MSNTTNLVSTYRTSVRRKSTAIPEAERFLAARPEVLANSSRRREIVLLYCRLALQLRARLKLANRAQVVTTRHRPIKLSRVSPLTADLWTCTRMAHSGSTPKECDNDCSWYPMAFLHMTASAFVKCFLHANFQSTSCQLSNTQTAGLLKVFQRH